MKNFTRIMLVSSLFAGAVMFASTASAQCDLYPFAVSADAVDASSPGSVINMRDGKQPGNFAWLTWTGNQSDNTLVSSLAGNGDSYTYVDPTGSGNNVIEPDSFIVAKDEGPDGHGIRKALNALEGQVITVPVWDSGSKLQIGTRHRQPVYETVYHVVGFVQVQITDYKLGGEHDHLTVLYLGYVTCGGGVD